MIFLFSAIFSLLYQFVPCPPPREFGLYNVLGMNKRNLARIVTWESLITAVLSLVLGLALGIVLSELAELDWSICSAAISITASALTLIP